MTRRDDKAIFIMVGPSSPNNAGRINMKKLLHDFVLEDDGVTSIEYALIASLMVVAIVSTVPLVGTAVAGLFQSVVNAFP